MKPVPARTMSPLHFEDVDPHRFEDLVRQLAYGYKRWETLEAVGRSGDDAGIDIRGVEDALRDTSDGVDKDRQDDVEGIEPGSLPAARTWLIQVKREKRFGPARARAVAAEATFDQESPPYGFILAGLPMSHVVLAKLSTKR